MLQQKSDLSEFFNLLYMFYGSDFSSGGEFVRDFFLEATNSQLDLSDDSGAYSSLAQKIFNGSSPLSQKKQQKASGYFDKENLINFLMNIDLTDDAKDNLHEKLFAFLKDRQFYIKESSLENAISNYFYSLITNSYKSKVIQKENNPNETLKHYHNLSKSLMPPLDAKTERKYLEAMLNGDEDSRLKLIESNLRLVSLISRKFQSDTFDYDDIFQIGTIGLIKAISTVKSDKNIRIHSYCSRYIENEILIYLKSQKEYRDIFDCMDMDFMKISDVLIYNLDDEHETGDMIENIKSFIINNLDEIERAVISNRYGFVGSPKTQKETAQILCITRSFVQRVEKRALVKIQRYLDNMS